MFLQASSLFLATTIVDFTAMAVTLWLAFYLFARGFPNKITLRTVVVLLAISIFYLSAYKNIFHQTVGTASWRAVCLIIGMAFWYSVTYHLMSKQSQRRFRMVSYGMYGFAFLTAILILTPGSFIREEGNGLYSAHMGNNPPNILYQIYQFAFLFFTLLNLLTDQRIGLASEGKYLLVASILPAGKIFYGFLAWMSPGPLPRFIPDLFLFCGVFILGLSVLRHQSLLERRTTFQDFPISALTILGISALYAFLALGWGISLESVASVVAIAILTHSAYDLVREFLDRLRLRREEAFRRQFRQLENQSVDEEMLRIRLQEGLNLLCDTLNASAGVIAVRRSEHFLVVATRGSVPVTTPISAMLVTCEDISRVKNNQLSEILWIAPAFEGQKQIAVVGIGKSKVKLEYSTGDLDLLAEVAGKVGIFVALSNLQSMGAAPNQDRGMETQANATELGSFADEMLATISTNPDAEFVKMVEDGLRHYADYIALGQSPLADWAGITAESHVERGKQLQALLGDAMESFRPAGGRPPEPLPRVWYSYVVLHDAYVEGVPNREIMARLYISEGTFNRTRRNALRALARLLIEKGGVFTKQ
jgi:hypothetical protein